MRQRPFAIGLLFLGLLAPLHASPAQAQEAPAAEDAEARLSTSPRHGEWVLVETARGPVNSWVVYPERADAAPVIVVIHEIFGLTDWVRSVADEFAAAGFIAIAPDLLWGKGPDGGGTSSLESPVRAIRDLDPDEVRLRLNGVAEYGTSLPAAAKKFGVVGFCWGGSTSFRYATQQPQAGAAVVYYGMVMRVVVRTNNKRVQYEYLDLDARPDDAYVTCTFLRKTKRDNRFEFFSFYSG